MTPSRKSWIAFAGLMLAIFAWPLTRTSPTSAQMAGGGNADAAETLSRSIQTKVITIEMDEQRGEPREAKAVAVFDRTVLAYWVSVVGVDMKFRGTTEKQINRQMFSVDPFAKVMNGKDLEITAKLGLRDGSGNWDDTYGGTITVAVTAVLAN